MIPALPRLIALRLIIIRSAMLLGVLLFGGVTWWLERQGSLSVLPPSVTRQLTYVFMIVAATSLAGVLFMRRRAARVTDEAQLATIYIIGYAMAEAAALFGAVIWYTGGRPDWYAAGVLLLVASFQVLPIKQQGS